MCPGTDLENNGGDEGIRTLDLPVMSHSVRSHLRLEIDAYDETILSALKRIKRLPADLQAGPPSETLSQKSLRFGVEDQGDCVGQI